jgi:hypothetical protein
MPGEKEIKNEKYNIDTKLCCIFYRRLNDGK